MSRITQITTIVNSFLSSLTESPKTLIYLPLIPLIAYQLVLIQWNHERYISSDLGFIRRYDYIVVGGGSAGSVMASRLSEDSSVSVLLLEAGYSEDFITDVPMAALILQKTPLDWSYVTEPQDKACFGMNGNQQIWARGKVMGGSSTLNTMVYMRGNSRDYNNWASNGASNWSWPEVFPYFIKAEDNKDSNYVNTGYHGKGGPLTVTSSQVPRQVSYAFQNSGPSFGLPIGDPNGPSQSVFTIPQRTIRDGMRCSVAKAYLESIADRKNLKVLNRAFVTKILFDSNKRAIGLQFEKNLKTYTVYANKEVIVSAGAINSPQLLMLSGIGPQDHLNSLGIPVVSDLPVGNNLQEHYLTGMSFTVNDSIGINLFHEFAPWTILEYEAYKNNSLTNNYVEGVAFYKTKYADTSDDYPDVQLFMIPATLSTDYGLIFYRNQGMKDSVWQQVYSPYVGFNTFAIYPMISRPSSRGTIRLKSTDPHQYPAIQPNIFDQEQDLNIMVEGMKFALQIAQTPAFQRYNATPFQTKFPGCEALDLYSDDYLKCMARSYTFITWHPSGTVKMGAASDPTAVVDPFCRVKGVTGLRVVDASIMPTIPSGNLNAPTVMIAEKVADIIKGRRLTPFPPPMTPAMISRLPTMDYQTIV